MYTLNLRNSFLSARNSFLKRSLIKTLSSASTLTTRTLPSSTLATSSLTTTLLFKYQRPSNCFASKMAPFRNLSTISENEFNKLPELEGLSEAQKKKFNKLPDLQGLNEKQKEAKYYCYLTLCYYQGVNNFPQDPHKAVEFCIKSADLGNASAQYMLATFYITGFIICAPAVSSAFVILEKNPTLAIKYLEAAVQQKHDQAELRLGLAYESGFGVPKTDANDIKAVELYQRSANQGNIDAGLHLGRCYQLGVGVIQDFDKATECFVKAYKKDAKKTKDFLIALEKEQGKLKNINFDEMADAHSHSNNDPKPKKK